MSGVRWYNEYEIAAQLLDTFGFDLVVRFVKRQKPPGAEEEAASPTGYLATLQALVPDVDHTFGLQMQMTAFKEVSEPLAKSCYFLEGNSVLLPYVAGVLRRIRTVLDPGTFPGLLAV